jgi:hypothetical protein
MDELLENFYVYLGAADINKFTKSTFMNLVTFAEKSGAKAIYLILNRDHIQKSNFLTNSEIGEFSKMFSIMDG